MGYGACPTERCVDPSLRVPFHAMQPKSVDPRQLAALTRQAKENHPPDGSISPTGFKPAPDGPVLKASEAPPPPSLEGALFPPKK